MNRRALLLVLLPFVASLTLTAQPPPKPAEVKLDGHTLQVPAGFVVERVAGPPLVDRPIVADFDERGRLYVAEANGSVTKDDVAQKKGMHQILRLEDKDGDGQFDRRVVFADKVLFPEGCMWLSGSLYVAAPPSIWKFTDTDDDGVADQRVEWHEGKTLTGCANDLHGPYAGLDGWIYWCKGAFARQSFTLPNGKPFTTRASHIYRCRPDGTGLEPVMTGGMDNPVDVAFTPGGERIFTTTFFQHPAGGKRDGLIHAVYGGVYGKDHDVVYEHKWTSPSLMPVMTHLGAAAPCGLTRYESTVFGKEYQDNLFACLFNMHKVTRHVLVPDGATFETRDEDFLVSDNVDFHPTDVLEDADGSLLVIDTGGWYKLCCPTSALHKPDVLGGIYRVRRKDAPKIDDPRGLKLDWKALRNPKGSRGLELIGLLRDDPRLVVKQKAMDALALGGDTIAELIGSSLANRTWPEIHREAIWVATRINTPGARKAIREALTDPNDTVRQAAIYSAGLWRDGQAVPDLLKLLRHESLPIRRAAAEALGRIGDNKAVPPLLAAVGVSDDRVLDHSLIYALIEIGDREAVAVGLTSPNPPTRRAALTALDQMDGGQLKVESVIRELGSPDSALRETAWWIAGRRPEWAANLVGVLRERLAVKNLSPADQEELTGHLARLARGPAVQQLLAERFPDNGRVALRAMARAGLKDVPDAWITRLTDSLAEDALRTEALATLRAVTVPKAKADPVAARLAEIAADEKRAADLRLNALAAVPGGLTWVAPATFDFLRSRLAPDLPAATRTLAADVFAKAKLTVDQLVALTENVKTAGPLELDRLLEAFASATDERVGRALVAALMASPARSSLRIDVLKPRLAKFGPALQTPAAELFAAVAADNARQYAKLDELLQGMKTGDIRRGHQVFNGSKAACISCHAVGYLGGKVGPDLTHVGKIRTERDLLEAIVFPSASFVRSYEPVQVTTKAGKAINGLLRKDDPDELVLVVGADQETRIPRDDIDEVVPSRVSVMPAGLDQQLTVQELIDLVAFLKACQ